MLLPLILNQIAYILNRKKMLSTENMTTLILMLTILDKELRKTQGQGNQHETELWN